MLKSEGWTVNVKRVERIWRREGLKVPQKQPKKGRLWLNDGSCVRLRPEYHDLTHPENAIMAIYNNLSERTVGDPATELGLPRIQDRDFPQVIANYANAFRYGRRAKSTSIGIRGTSGDYVAALCLNIDLTLFNNFQSAINEFTKVEAQELPMESLSPANVDALHSAIDQFAARRFKTPRSLKTDERKALVKELKTAGFMDMRRAADTVGAYLGVSRSTIYVDARD